MTVEATPAPPAATPPEATPVPPEAAMAPVGAFADRMWTRFVSWSPPFAVAALVGLTVARTGIRMAWADAPYWVRLAEAFPEPLADWRSGSVLGPALGHLGGVHDSGSWLGLHLAVLVGAVALVGALLVARFPTREGRTHAAAWLALGSVAPALALNIGSYDPYTFAGAALVVWGRRWWLAALGGFLLGATSAEQGVVGLAAATIVALALVDGEGVDLVGRLRRAEIVPRVVVGGIVIVVTRAAVLVWWSFQDIDVPTRADVFGSYLGPALGNASGAALAGVYAFLGVGWALLLFTGVAGGWTRARWSVVLLGLVGVPASVTITTLDGTRVFAMVSLAAYLVLITHLVDGVAAGTVDRRLAGRATALALLASPLLPALLTDPSGHAFFVLPFK